MNISKVRGTKWLQSLLTHLQSVKLLNIISSTIIYHLPGVKAIKNYSKQSFQITKYYQESLQKID